MLPKFSCYQLPTKLRTSCVTLTKDRKRIELSQSHRAFTHAAPASSRRYGGGINAYSGIHLVSKDRKRGLPKHKQEISNASRTSFCFGATFDPIVACGTGALLSSFRCESLGQLGGQREVDDLHDRRKEQQLALHQGRRPSQTAFASIDCTFLAVSLGATAPLRLDACFVCCHV